MSFELYDSMYSASLIRYISGDCLELIHVNDCCINSLKSRQSHNFKDLFQNNEFLKTCKIKAHQLQHIHVFLCLIQMIAEHFHIHTS